MELLCIQTHSQGIVKSGEIWPFLSDAPPCSCRKLANVIDVGIRLDGKGDGISPSGKKEDLTIGQYVTCVSCGDPYKYEGIWWICRSLFAPIATESEMESYKQKKELSITK